MVAISLLYNQVNIESQQFFCRKPAGLEVEEIAGRLPPLREGGLPYAEMVTRDSNKMQNPAHDPSCLPHNSVPFGVTYEKIGTIQRRLAWPLHKDDTLSRSGRSTDLNIYFVNCVIFQNFLPMLTD